MKRYFAVFLIALMAVSVLSAAGVVTTKPVAAADPAPYLIDVNAPAGTTYSWTQKMMNFHYNTNDPLNLIVSKSKGNTASVTLKTQPGQYAQGQADVGVALQPGVPVGTRPWELAKDRLVSVKVTTKTDLSLKGDKLVAAEAGVDTFGTWPHPSIYEFVLLNRYTGSPTQNVKGTLTYSATETTTVDTTLEHVYTGICAMVLVETGINPSTTLSQQASAKVVVESIELTLL